MSALSEALLAAQKNMPRLTKDESADTGKFSYRYLSLEGLLRAVLPVLNEHGLTVMQKPGMYEGQAILETRLIHFTGDTEVAFTPLALHGEYTAQMQGSAITYARRYALLAMLGLAPDEDDDGAKASGVAVRSAHGNVSPEVPQTAASPDAPTRQQHAQLAVLLKELDDGREMNLAYWTDEARDYIRRRYNKVSRTQLTREEMSSLIGWAQDRKTELDVPFG